MPVESRADAVSGDVELGPLPVDDRHDDVSVTTGTALNGGSSVAVNLADLEVDAVKPDAAYLTPPRIRHPLDENVFCAFSISLFYYLFGLVVGVPIFSLLLCALALAIPLRLIYLLFLRWSHPSAQAPRLSLRRPICDPWWPVQNARENVRAVVTLQRALAANDVADQLTRRLTGGDVSDTHGTQFDYFRRRKSTTSGRCCWADWSLDSNFQIGDHVRDWSNVASSSGRRQSFPNGGSSGGGDSSEEAIRLDGIRDLQELLNGKDLIDERKPPWSVVLVPTFGNYEEGTGCSLALIDLHPRLASHVCTHRLVSLWTDGSVFFDIEPKLRRPIIGLTGQPIVPPYSVLLSASHCLWTVAQFICGGPLSLMSAALRRYDPVWTRSRPQQSRWTTSAKRLSAGNKYRVTSERDDRRKGSSLCGSTALMGSEGRSTRRVSWMRIANADQVLRAERILRAATVELMLAFVAGALRRHFRSQGIRHPPDVRIALPISYREYMPVEGRVPCDTVLMPMKIPTSVEGNIPRVWDVQRRLADAFDDAFPNAMRAARSIGHLLMPYSWYQSVLSSAYSDSACIVSFFRVSGDMNVHARKLQSMLFYPSVPDKVQAAWTFIQCGTEMMVSLSVDGRTFPNPDTLLVHFKAETQSLLNQLSVRLLTLSQATFLPPRPLINPKSTLHPALSGRRSDPCQGNRPSESGEQTVLLDDSRPGAANRSSRSPSVSQTASTPALTDLLAPVDQMVELESGGEEREATLEELERLLATVQSELDMMRDNPQGDRAEYVAKLTELERRMEAFHRSIAERLGPAACKVHEDVELASSAVASLLAPYRDESASSGGRRFSREFLRRDSKASAVIMRKQSKRVESPTRRVSPKISSADLQHLQQP